MVDYLALSLGGILIQFIFVKGDKRFIEKDTFKTGTIRITSVCFFENQGFQSRKYSGLEGK